MCQVIATDLNDTEHTGVANVYIDLINWNDEQPIFEHSSLTVNFKETEGEGFYVGTMLAMDRDIGDEVESVHFHDYLFNYAFNA